MGFSCSNRFPAFPALLFLVLFMFTVYVYSPSNQSNGSPERQCSQPADSQPKFNLMEETYGSEWDKQSVDKYLSSSYCTIEYANTFKLQQDHPCVIRLIRDNYIGQPAPKNVPYQMDHPETIDPSDGQSKEILRILKNLTNGFFIECGGFDGEFLSNTLYMERSLDWTGLLVEADKKAYGQLTSRNRKAYTSPACLSTKPYPMEVVYNGTVGAYGAILEEKLPQSNSLTDESNKIAPAKDTEHIYKMQCFPLYSLLLAIGRTQVDYFGLDVEGSEFKILETIPWHKVNIKTITAEWNHVPGGEAGLTRLMESNKYTKTGLISNYYTREVVYVRNSFLVYE